MHAINKFFADLCAFWRPRQTRTGFFASSFDPFPHPGTVALLRTALDRGHCDAIILALHVDPSVENPDKPRPYLSPDERRVMLEQIHGVVAVVQYETEAELRDLLIRYAPDVRLLGSEYVGKPFTGDDLNIHVEYFDPILNWNRADYIRRIKHNDFWTVDKSVWH